MLLEAGIVGLLASLIGLGLGVLAAKGLEALLSGFGVSLPSGSLVFELRTVVVGLAVGIGVTVVSAISPARRAVRIPPVAALATQSTESEVSSRRRIIMGGACCIVGVALLGVGLANGAIVAGGPRRCGHLLGCRDAGANRGATHGTRDRTHQLRVCSGSRAGWAERTPCAARAGRPRPPPLSWSGWRSSRPCRCSEPRSPSRRRTASTTQSVLTSSSPAPAAGSPARCVCRVPRPGGRRFLDGLSGSIRVQRLAVDPGWSIARPFGGHGDPADAGGKRRRPPSLPASSSSTRPPRRTITSRWDRSVPGEVRPDRDRDDAHRRHLRAQCTDWSLPCRQPVLPLPLHQPAADRSSVRRPTAEPGSSMRSTTRPILTPTSASRRDPSTRRHKWPRSIGSWASSTPFSPSRC